MLRLALAAILLGLALGRTAPAADANPGPGDPNDACSGAFVFHIDGKPWRGASLQGAIDASPPGAVLSAPSCTFFESVKITKPLRLRSASPGGATITGARQDRPAFVPVAGTAGLHRARIGCAPAWVMYGDRSLMDYRRLSNLESFTYPTGARQKAENVPGPTEGFVNADGFLYVRLRGDLDPNDPALDLRPARCEATHGLFVAASDVSIEGFNITNFPGSGIAIHGSARSVSISHNRLSGTRTGVAVWTNPSDRAIVIESNEYSATPTYQHRGAGDDRAWAGLYDSNLATRFLFGAANGLIVRRNYIYESFDGIEVKGGSENLAPATTTDISLNVIQNIVDNALEFDSASKIAAIRAHHNLMIDAYAYLSLSPFQAGRAMVDHNLFYTSPEAGLNRSYWVKLKLFPGTSALDAMTDITLAHNTAVLGDDSTRRSWLHQTDPGLSYVNSVMVNNALLFSDSGRSYGLGPTSDPERMFGFGRNLIWGARADASLYPTPPLRADPLLKADGRVTFAPPPGSPLIDGGVVHPGLFQTPSRGAPDIGAIEAGLPLSSVWPLAGEKAGPSWVATGSPLRPPLPKSIAPIWAGR